MESLTATQLNAEKEHNHTLTIDSDKKSFEDVEDKDREKHRESSRYKSKDERKRHRVEKDKESRDPDNSRPNVNSDREMRANDWEKDGDSRSDRRKDDRVDSEKCWHKGKREGHEKIDKEMDNDRKKDRRREKERAQERDTEKEEKIWDRDYERHRERDRDRVREKRKDRDKDLKKGSEEGEIDRDRRREKRRDKERDDGSSDGEKERHHRKAGRMTRNVDYERNDILEFGTEGFRDSTPSRKGYRHDENDSRASEYKNSNEDISPSPTKLEERILKMKEERLRHTSATASGSEVLSWVNKSRKLEERRNQEKEKALQLSRMFEEQDNVNQEEIDDALILHATENLAGMKVLHGLEKVVEGGAVVLTLKDQNILSGGGINEELDMLENVEIGEQKERDAAYMAAKKTSIYEDKFSKEAGSEKTILPQYDVPTIEGLALDERGQFSGEAGKKLEELRRRLQGASMNNHFEDLDSYLRSSTDYYTQDEMLRFKKPKKKKSLRKKEKLDIDTLEAEAVSAGLGRDDLGSRNSERLTSKEEKERLEAEKRNIAYQVAYSKADEASKALRMEQTLTVSKDEVENLVFEEDDEELYKSVERARKLALKKQNEETSSGPRALALLASAAANNQAENTESSTKENRVVFTEMEEFVWGLQLDEEEKKPEGEDVFMEEDQDLPPPSSLQILTDPTGLVDTKLQNSDEVPALDETIEEPAVGKGLSGALKLLKERGTLKETVEWGGRNMDKKKSKLVGINEGEGMKEIRIERTDEFGRILTPKESFRLLSHKFHGKGPGKMKQEKRMKQYQEELKLKKMKNSDTPSLSVERMKEAQARLKTPYLVLSGHVKPGQTSDPASGFATVEKEFAGGLTPMLGDRKVEHFLGIKK